MCADTKVPESAFLVIKTGFLEFSQQNIDGMLIRDFFQLCLQYFQKQKLKCYTLGNKLSSLMLCCICL